MLILNVFYQDNRHQGVSLALPLYNGVPAMIPVNNLVMIRTSVFTGVVPAQDGL